MCCDEGLRDEPPSSFCYGIVVQACARGGNVERAGELLNEMMEKRILVEASSIGSIISAYIRADMLDEDESKRCCYPDGWVRQLRIDCLCLGKAWTDASCSELALSCWYGCLL